MSQLGLWFILNLILYAMMCLVVTVLDLNSLSPNSKNIRILVLTRSDMI